MIPTNENVSLDRVVEAINRRGAPDGARDAHRAEGGVPGARLDPGPQVRDTGGGASGERVMLPCAG